MPATTEPVLLTTPTDDDRAFYDREGYVLLGGLIAPETVRTLHAEVMEVMAIEGLGQTKLRQSGQYRRGSLLDAYVNSPNLRCIASALMGGDASLYMPFTAVKSAYGGGEFHFHQDNQYTRFDGPGINLWLALSPMNEQTGCLKVIPRSHLDGTLPSQQSPDKDNHRTITFTPENFVPVVMEPGDCVAFTRLTVHGSGPNLSDTHRVAYAVQYHRDDVNYTTDGGETWTLAKTHPRWPTTPANELKQPASETPEKRDGH